MKSKKPSELKYYKDLELPIATFNKIRKNGDISALLLSKRKLTKKILQTLISAWENICNEHFEEFKDMYVNFLDIQKKRVELLLLKNEFEITQDRSLLTDIDISELELSNLKKPIRQGDFMKEVMMIEKKFHFQIDENKTSTRKFYSYLTNLN